MPCYHPIKMQYIGVNDDGKKMYHFTGIQDTHRNPNLTDYDSLNKILLRGDIDYCSPEDILIPCRKCIGCRLDYSRRWADRLMLELDHSKTALFLTLTYDNDHVTPAMYDDDLNTWFYTLVKRDLQLFNKRLRYFFPGKEIRFYAAGEYGDTTLRPHYHGIYFGLSLSDFPDHQFFKFNHAKQPLFISSFLTSIWGNGHVSFGNVSWQSCAYVARYNLKKLGNGSDNLALSRNCVPEFSLMSRRPGIAGYFPVDHPEIFDNPRDKIVITDNNGIRSVGSVNMPSFIFNKLEVVNPELYGIIKEEKKLASIDSFLSELLDTDLDEFEYLNLKEKNHERSVRSLKRPSV